MFGVFFFLLIFFLRKKNGMRNEKMKRFENVKKVGGPEATKESWVQL